MPLASLLPLGIIMGAIGVCGTLLSVIPYATRGEVRARTHARAHARRGHAHAEAAIRGVRRQRCGRHSRHVPCCGSRTSWHCQRLRGLLNWQDRQDRQLWQPWKSWHGCSAGGSSSAANSSSSLLLSSRAPLHVERGCKSTGPGLPLSHLLLRRARPSGADREPPVPLCVLRAAQACHQGSMGGGHVRPRRFDQDAVREMTAASPTHVQSVTARRAFLRTDLLALNSHSDALSYSCSVSAAAVSCEVT